MMAVLALIAVSCNTDDVENRPAVTGIDAPVLFAPEEGNVYILNPDNMDVLAERFVWTDANFGEGIIPSYTIEIDRQGDNFDTPSIIGTTAGETQFAASNATLNNALLALDVTPFEAANFEVRIKANVGSEVMYSNAVEMIITPYTTEAPKMYVVGNFLNASGYGSDWDPASAVMIQAPAYGDTNFEGYVWMDVAAPEFKFLPTNTSFDGDYGDDGSFSGALAQTDESNIVLSAPGYYLIKADTDAMTYSAVLTSWAVTGSATPLGWPDNGVQDYNMTFDPVQKVWTITLALSAGELKFRANDAWDLNYGDDGADGYLNQGGANIVVATAGTYKITLDLNTPRAYTYSVVLQ